MDNSNMDMQWLDQWLDQNIDPSLSQDAYPSPSEMLTDSPPQDEDDQQQQSMEVAFSNANDFTGMQDPLSGTDWGNIDHDWSVPLTGDVLDQFSISGQNFLPLVSDNQIFASQLPIDQQAHAYTSQSTQQDGESLGESPYDNFSPSHYPSPDDLSANSLPYCSRDPQQHGNYVVDAYNMGFNGNGRTTISRWGTRGNPLSNRRSQRPLDIRQKVSLNREAKKRGDPSCDPALCYSSDIVVPKPWGSLTWDGQPSFTYTHKGQWLLDRSFDAKQMRKYVENCPKDAVFWIQQTPTQCNHRLDPEDRICRWSCCPVPNRNIAAGWLRVVFDEFPALTSNGSKDPLKYAGSMHLWCFEQIFDPMEFHMSGRLRPEDRKFPNEDKSVVTLEKLTDAGIVRDAYRPWFHERMDHWKKHGPAQVPRIYEESLSYRLNKYHLDNQTAARQKARLKRNAHRADDEKRTIDVHIGNLGFFVEASKRVKRASKTKKLRTASADNVDSWWAVDSTDDSQSSPRSISSHNNGRNTRRAVPQHFNSLIPRSVPVQPLGSYHFRPRKGPSLSDIPEEFSPKSVMPPTRTTVQPQTACPNRTQSLALGSRPNPIGSSQTRLQGNAMQSLSTQAAAERPMFFNPLGAAQVRAPPQVQPRRDASQSQNPSTKHRMAFPKAQDSVQTQSLFEAGLEGGMQQNSDVDTSQCALDIDDLLEEALFQDGSDIAFSQTDNDSISTSETTQSYMDNFDLSTIFVADNDPSRFVLGTDATTTNNDANHTIMGTKRKRGISDEYGDQNKKSAHRY